MGKLPDSPGESATSYSQARTVPRYTIVAATEFTSFATARKFSGTVEEISRKGCYVDTMNVLPVGTSLNISISHNQQTYVTKGEVIYAFERRGMGIVFIDTQKEQMEILDSWLAEGASNVAII